MKKKIMAICLVVALAAVAVIGGTLAFFTDEETATNTFTVGNVDITLDEAVVTTDEDGNYIADEDARTEEGNEYTDIFPGQTICKDPTITNVGSYDAFVKADIVIGNDALVAMHCYDAEADMETSFPYDGFKTVVTGGDVMSCTDYEWSEEADNGIADGFINDDYLLVFTDNGDGTTTFTVYVLEPIANTDKVVIFETINVPADLNNDDFEKIENGFEMNITASAIQSKGFESAGEEGTTYDPVAAFEALATQQAAEAAEGGGDDPEEEPTKEEKAEADAIAAASEAESAAFAASEAMEMAIHQAEVAARCEEEANSAESDLEREMATERAAENRGFAIASADDAQKSANEAKAAAEKAAAAAEVAKTEAAEEAAKAAKEFAEEAQSYADEAAEAVEDFSR